MLLWKKKYVRVNQYVIFYKSTDRGLKPFRFCGDRGGNENKCSNEDGGKICYCDTNLCNADTAESLAVRFFLNWNTLMAFGLFLVLTIKS